MQEEADAEETAKQQDGGMESDAKKTRRKSAKDKQKADKGDTNRPVLSRHIMPENGTMVNLPNEVSPRPAVNMTIEEAGNIVCTFGIYNNNSYNPATGAFSLSEPSNSVTQQEYGLLCIIRHQAHPVLVLITDNR